MLRHVLIVEQGTRASLFGPYSGTRAELLDRLPELLAGCSEWYDEYDVFVVGLLYGPGGVLTLQEFTPREIGTAVEAARAVIDKEVNG